jgi:hypothetical protein
MALDVGLVAIITETLFAALGHLCR